MKIPARLLFVFCLVGLIRESVAEPPYAGRTPSNRLTASDDQDGDRFGYSVALTERHALVGAVFEDGAGSDRGAAYLFNPASGLQLRKFTASDATDNDSFGISVALTERFAVVGASDAENGGTGRGAAYVYDLETGVEIDKLSASDAEDNDYFGLAVAASAEFALVGAFGEDGAGSDRGAAYVFDLTTGTELFKLTASDGADSDEFGGIVRLSGNLALVGSPAHDNRRGAVYVFDLATGTQIFKLTASDAADFDLFGSSIGVSGNLAVIGAVSVAGGGGQRGAVYVFDLTTGAQRYKLTASDAEDLDNLGSAVAVSGNLAIASAPNKNGSQGALYAFDLVTGGELGKFTASDGEAIDRLGDAVALDGNLAFAGAPGDEAGGSDRGSVYAFLIPDRRPDLISGTGPFSGAGRGIQNTSASGQTIALTSRKLAQVSGYVTATNAGDTGDAFTLAGTAGTGDFALTYLRRTGAAESNVTAALLAGTHREPNVAPGEPGRVFRATVKPSNRLKKKKKGKTTYLRKTFVTRITATSETHSFRKDAAAVQVSTR